jgi:hypothetical protein
MYAQPFASTGEIAGVQPAVVVDGFPGGLSLPRYPAITLGPVEPDFTCFAQTVSGREDFGSSLRVDDLRGGIGHGPSDRAPRRTGGH